MNPHSLGEDDPENCHVQPLIYRRGHPYRRASTLSSSSSHSSCLYFVVLSDPSSSSSFTPLLIFEPPPWSSCISVKQLWNLRRRHASAPCRVPHHRTSACGRPHAFASHRCLTLAPLLPGRPFADALPSCLCSLVFRWATPHPRASAPWSSVGRRLTLAPLLPGRRLYSLVGELPGRLFADASPLRLCSLVAVLCSLIVAP
ncbi:hypothetical protein Syun_023521 [Stephania yunnanensis]|uniref:Uncharacterized protein n=1 Tax=Stephania yunnanensis TaxID=152371 RepID=A0AAP0FC61_9MAGN